ncbi:MAG: diguanylate cyclase, partial [Desulfovibrionaceae bacterium]|nr:diguanylate cyclase [Desulfovibrionaceae bacterium]
AGLWFAGTPLNKLMKIEKEAITQSIKLSVILLVVMLALFVLVGFHVSAPIREISRYITNVSDDKKDAALDIHTNDDMGRLADNLRDMVKKLQARTEEFRDLSYRDQLTNLWNRRYFPEAFQREIELSVRYATPLSLGMADIDHFKRVNDTFGHDAGDVVLRHIAALLQKNLRNSDIVARYGGEEFILLLPHTRQKTAAGVLEKLRRLCEQTGIEVNGKTIRVTISFGLVSLPEKTRTPADVLIKHADIALYQSKQNGRNRITIYQEADATGSETPLNNS